MRIEIDAVQTAATTIRGRWDKVTVKFPMTLVITEVLLAIRIRS